METPTSELTWQGHVARWLVRWIASVVAVGLVSAPISLERAIENASFDDRVGTLPVEVSLAHNGFVTFDTGLLGKVYWRHSGSRGFGAVLRSTGPPVAGGTLASYVSPGFVQANTRFLDDPEQAASAYGDELRAQVVRRALSMDAIAALLGGTAVALAWSIIGAGSRRTRWTAAAVGLGVGLVGGSGLAVLEFRAWSGNESIGPAYPLPGQADLSFSSPQAREIAQQVQPFIEKNTARIRERTASVVAQAQRSLADQLPAQADGIQPRDGEVVVLAEADPQGSFVGTEVRRELYGALAEVLPTDAVVLRTIAGDITSNGTVAEAGFVRGEVSATPDVPVVAAKGDHDTDVTVDQLSDAGAEVPDVAVVDAGGLLVASARDPAFKALFGGLVVNDTGTTEQDIGAALRHEVDAAVAGSVEEVPGGSVSVVLHQPRAVEGYLGVGLDTVRRAGSSLTTPIDDGVPDLPPGIVTIGHLHDAGGPWVLWNTGSDQVTWTVVTQLGTSGGVEENPTFNRFSTPFSAPLKAISVQLQYVDAESGLQTGMVPIAFAPDGTMTIGRRVDVGLAPESQAAPPPGR